MKKLFVLVIFSITFLESCSLMDGKLSGVITYYFNDNYGEKPDVGAQIYIISTKDFNADSADQISDFRLFKSSYRYCKSELKLKSIQSSLDKKDLERSEKLDSNLSVMSEKALKSILKLKYSKHTKELVADGNGAFSINLPIGEYFVLIKSNHREGFNCAELDGQINIQTIKIEFKKETTTNAKFDIE